MTIGISPYRTLEPYSQEKLAKITREEVEERQKEMNFTGSALNDFYYVGADKYFQEMRNLILLDRQGLEKDKTSKIIAIGPCGFDNFTGP